MRLERHHLKTRGSHPELKYDPRNIVTLCAEVHQLVTAGWIDIEGTDADKRLIFGFIANAPEELKRSVVLTKRRSQRRATE